MGDRARLKTLVQTPAADSHREGGEESLSLLHAPVHTRNQIGCRYTLFGHRRCGRESMVVHTYERFGRDGSPK
jgi:hypothetical protein